MGSGGSKQQLFYGFGEPRPPYTGPIPPYAGPVPPTGPPQQFAAQPQQQFPGAFGLFAPCFSLFREMDQGGNSVFKISLGQGPGPVHYIATLHNGLSSDLLSLYRGDAVNIGPPIVSVDSTGFSGTRMEIIWANGRREELRSSDMQSIKFDFGGETFKWALGDKHRASQALGQDSGKAWELVRKDSPYGEVLAVFGETRGFTYVNGSGKVLFLGAGASGQLGPYWADVAVVALLKLWQIRGIRKIASSIG